MKKNTKQALIDAREIVATSWTQCAFARNENGNETDPLDFEARSWSAKGAIQKAIWFTNHSHAIRGRYFRILNALEKHGISHHELDGREIENWNDDPARTQDDVIAAFDRAIAAS